MFNIRSQASALAFALTATFALCAAAHAQSTPTLGTDPSTPPVATGAKAEPYFIVTRIDPRKCAHPVCGGFFVKAVNSARTRCADGQLAKECHVLELDTRALDWSDEQRGRFTTSFAQGKALVKGALEPRPRGLHSADVLRVTEAWQGQGSNKRPIGVFYSVRNNGIVCIQAPCPSFSLTLLNRPAAARPIDAVDFSPAHASDEAEKAAWAALEKGPILAAGAVTTYPAFSPVGDRVQGHKLLSSEFYLPAKP